jgi:hypothetical protein
VVRFVSPSRSCQLPVAPPCYNLEANKIRWRLVRSRSMLVNKGFATRLLQVRADSLLLAYIHPS